MTNLANLNVLLTKELGDSEINNKTTSDRDRAINDALGQIFRYRSWRELYTNKTIQFIDGVAHIPKNLSKLAALWYGKEQTFFQQMNNVSQTDFLNKPFSTFAITEKNDIQVLKISDSSNKGYDAINLEYDSFLGINNAAATEKLGQAFISGTTLMEGVNVLFSKQGSPTGTLTFNIYATAASLPIGSPLVTGVLNISEISSTKEWFWLQVDSLNLTEGDTYALEVVSSYSTDPNNYIKWFYKTTSVTTGTRLFYNGAWNTGVGDMAFAIATDFWNIQYIKQFVPLVNATDDSGLPDYFDQAIAKMACGIIWEVKSDQNFLSKFYGRGNESNPEQNSAFGLLNQIWEHTMFDSSRPMRRISTIFDKRDQYQTKINSIYY